MTINLGRSSDPDLESEVITDVASYGRQLGRIEDLLAVLIRSLPQTADTAEGRTAIAAFEELRAEIQAVKHRRQFRARPADARTA